MMISRTQIEDAPLKKKQKFNLISKSDTSLVNDDWLVFEILTRLPMKTLFRFKTVCKRWYSLIQKDQNFIDSHLLLSRSRVRPLFIINPVQKKIYITVAELTLFQDDDNNKGGDNTHAATNVVVVDTLREVDWIDFDIISNPVNGLICLWESTLDHPVRIWNISTRELSPSFESSLYSKEIERDVISGRRMAQHHLNCDPSYHFGFDPSTNEHKLVCLWKFIPHDLQHKKSICEVLTVGRQGITHGWRRIEEVPDVPSYELGEDSVHVNGVIYWNSLHLNDGLWDSKYRPIFIVAFDVGREKFRKITVSDFILDQPGDDFGTEYNTLCSLAYSTCCNERVNLLEVTGRLAMLVRMNKCMFKMYIYEGDDYELDDEINKTPTGSGGSFSSNNNGRWSEASIITLPFNLGKRCGVRFCKFVGSDDEIILAQSEGPGCYKETGKKKCVSFYSYNWKKGSWREYEVRIPTHVPHICVGSFVTTFSESLLPINNDKDQTSSTSF